MLIVYPPSSKSAVYLPFSFANKSAYLYASAVASSNVPLNSAVCLLPFAKIKFTLIVTSSSGFFSFSILVTLIVIVFPSSDVIVSNILYSFVITLSESSLNSCAVKPSLFSKNDIAFPSLSNSLTLKL